MLPYQTVPMDYTGALGRQGAAAFTHSWFVPAELCVPFKHNSGLLEPGILELRKEKSRDAARSRRGKENYEFYELAKMLPLPAAITSQLDKASIIRLTISYLKLRDFSGHGDPPWSRDKPAFSKSINTGVTNRTANIAHEIFEHHQGTHILQSLDGFAFALGSDGRFLYISETVSIYLGLSQVEMTGSSIFDYVHHQDHSEVAEQLGLGLTQGGSGSLGSPQGSEEGTTASPATKAENYQDYENLRLMSLNGSTYKGLDRTFCIRMKSTLTKRGCHFKSSGYRVVLLLCRLRPQYQFSHSRKSSPPLLGMVALAIALPPPSVHEIRLESDMFVTRLNFDFTIAHCEPRVSELLDYTADEITGMNMYTLCHGEDAHRLRKSHIDLINKGQVLTHYYRVMNKNGGYTWVQTCATVVCNSKNADEQNIICVNYVVSGREYKNLIMDCCQLEDHVAARSVKREDTSGNDPENGSPGSDTGEGRSSGGAHHPERHMSGPDLEEDGTEGPSDQRGRGIMDHAAQLHDHPQINNVLSRGVKKGVGERRGVKRKGVEEESSCCSSDEEGPPGGGGGVRKRYPVLSPASSSCHSSVVAGSPKPPPEDSDGGGGTSVKDLEQAMSKHLPVMEKGATPAHQPTDFSTDTLLKAQQQRSTIQWIGTHHHLHQQQGLPASTLLRQLYAANRESVIRANVTAGRSGPGYYPDMNHTGPLPTPPGSDGSYTDQFVLHNQKNDFGLYTAGSGYTVDYHSAMTPPSSVSPRDKHNQQLHSGFESPVYSEALRQQYLGEAPAQPLPLKPQPYPVHPGALDYATTSLDQQFYHHSAPPTGFHLYHPSNKTPAPSPGVYTDPLKNSTNWYSTPS